MSTSHYHLGNHDQHTPDTAAMPLAARGGVPGPRRSNWSPDWGLAPTACFGRCMTAHSERIGLNLAAGRKLCSG